MSGRPDVVIISGAPQKMRNHRSARRRLIQILACVVGWLVAPETPAASAQAVAQLTGVVRDSSGAVLPGVTVTVTGTALTSPRAVITNELGRYELDKLPMGRYVVEATLSGFGPNAVEIAIVGEAATHDVVLVVSSLSESVTVTATRTGAADIQSTPIAMTAFSARTIEELGIQAVEGLAGFAPTLTVSQNGGGRPLITIRGIGSGALGDPSSVVYLDGVYLARPAMVSMDFLDVERVEVLRGPQGTLYGRNSVGGAIHILTRPPTNELDASVRLTAGSFDRLRAEGAVRGPLVKNKAMGSFAFLRGTRDGVVKDLNHPGHSLGGEDTWAGRGQLRVVFATQSELLLSGDYGRFDGIPLPYAKPIMAKPEFRFDNPSSLWEVRASDLSTAENIQQGASAKLAVRLSPAMTLTSLTAYRKSNDHFFVDRDGTELAILTSDASDTQRQVSQELTVAHRTPRLTWIGGAFFFDDRDYNPAEITDLARGVQNRPFSTTMAHAWALFGQATFNVSSQASITGGLRYSDEEKDLHNTGGVFRRETDILANAASFYDFVDSAEFGAWTPKVSIQWQPSRDTFVYASTTRGFKSGGFTPTAPQPGRGYNPEFAWSYEGGVKHAMASRRILANVAMFYNDYQDLQVQSFILPGVVDISNAASATITGVELEVAAAAWRGLRLGSNMSWLDATYDRYLAVGPGNVTGDAAGHRLNNAPEWSGSGSAAYEFAAGRTGRGSVRGDVSWQSRVFFTPFNDAIEAQGAYGLVHLRAGFEPRSRRWELAVYVRNLHNQDYITGALTNAMLPAIIGRPGEPRLWGTQFTIRR